MELYGKMKMILDAGERKRMVRKAKQGRHPRRTQLAFMSGCDLHFCSGLERIVEPDIYESDSDISLPCTKLDCRQISYSAIGT